MRPWYRFSHDVVQGLFRLLYGIRIKGRQNLPETGPALIACNHRSLFDPPLIGCLLPEEAGFVAKAELFRVPVLAGLIRSLNAIPIDRRKLSLEKMDELAEFLGTGKFLLYFPEGTRQATGQLGRAKVGVGVLLSKQPVTVIPTYVEGTETPIRSLFRRGRIRVAFGRPFALPKEADFSDEKDWSRAIADEVMDQIRALKEQGEADNSRESSSR